MEVSDLAASAEFYDAVFAPLGWRRHADSGHGVGWGIARPWFFISEGGTPVPGSEVVCLSAPGIAAVKGAWEAGMEAGGLDDGKPGQRTDKGPSYYSAQLRDPDGHRIEIAVAGE
jgi:predicted lactoylglutathione lyase